MQITLPIYELLLHTHTKDSDELLSILGIDKANMDRKQNVTISEIQAVKYGVIDRPQIKGLKKEAEPQELEFTCILKLTLKDFLRTGNLYEFGEDDIPDYIKRCLWEGMRNKLITEDKDWMKNEEWHPSDQDIEIQEIHIN